METAPSKPVYHRPMPWQTVVALAFTGLNGLALAMMALGLAAIAAAAPERLRWVPLLGVVLVTLGSVIHIILGACIIARLNRARKLAIVVNFILLLFAVMTTVVNLTLGDLNWAAVASGAFSLLMISLLGSERSQAYTYRGEDDSWPGE